MLRNSQIALLAALGVVLLGIVVVIGAFRLAVSGFVDDASADGSGLLDAASSDNSAETSLDLADFDRVLIRDSWVVELRRGDEYRVDLSYPADHESDIEASVEDGRLVVDREDGGARGPWRWFGRGQPPFEARITLPALAELELAGSGRVELTGFEGEDLILTISGAGQVEGRDSRFENLELTISGAANVDFERIPVTNARVELAGASNVMLLMNGGVLTGNLSGFGNVSYEGSVSEESVRVSGFGRVGRN
jgi:hypothetical protein